MRNLEGYFGGTATLILAGYNHLKLHWPVPALDWILHTMMKRSRGFDYRRHLQAPPICLFLAVASLGLGATPPLSFEANQGQTDPAVNFLSRGDGYALFLTPDSAVFKLRSSRENSAPSVVRMKLAGADPHARVSGTDTLPGTVNYFLGNDPNKWISGVSTFGRVNYRQIYRGIDLVYYGTQRQLEYDFIVAPGADTKQIGLEFAGARPVLGADGSLMLTLNGAPLAFRKPVVIKPSRARRK